MSSRGFDCVFDPVYTVSALKSYNKDLEYGMSEFSRLKCFPVFHSMFTSLAHYDRLKYRRFTYLSNHYPIQFSTSRISPYKVDIDGRDRVKFFSLPVDEALTTQEEIAARAQSAAEDVTQLLQTPSPPLAPARAASTRTQHAQGTQTVYRDSQTQTDAYSCAYTVVDGDWAEELSLTSLVWGRGLPIGQLEVELIERLRRKRRWMERIQAATRRCPQLNLMWRLKLVEVVEREEWRVREGEIREIQTLRCQLMKKIQEEQRLKQEECLRQLMEFRKQKLDEALQLKEQRDDFNNSRELRRIRNICNMKYLKKFPKYENRHIPGKFRNTCTQQIRSYQNYLNSIQGIIQLEKEYGHKLTNCEIIKPPKPVSYIIKNKHSKRFHVEQQILLMYEEIKANKLCSAEKQPRALRFLERVEHPTPRVLTPDMPECCPLSADTECEQAVLRVQSALRGRSRQVQLARGLARRADLVQELRSTHALDRAEKVTCALDRDRVMYTQQCREAVSSREARIEEVFARVEGASVSRLLEQLSNELVRLQEARRIHAICMLAERERLRRELREDGLRQRELRRYREIEEIYKRMTRSQHTCIDQYIMDILADTVETKADRDARAEIVQLAAGMDEVVQEMEQRQSSSHWASQEYVADLVHSFLVPEVQRENSRRAASMKRSLHLRAARDIIMSQYQAGQIRELEVDQSQTVSTTPDGSQADVEGPQEPHFYV